jgi:hypothetical protein
MEVIKGYVCPKFLKSAWSAVEIVVAVVPWPTETVCSRLVVAMCVCTRRVRWATTILSRMTINVRGWSGGRHRKRLLKSRGRMEWCIIMLLRQGVVQSLSGKKVGAFGKKGNRCFTDNTSLHAQLLSKFLCTRWQVTVV